MLIILLLLLVMIKDSNGSFGFLADGSLSYVTKIQHLIESDPSVSAAFGIKYRSAQVLVSIAKTRLHKRHNETNMTPSSVFYKNDKAIAVFVGQKAGCLEGHRRLLKFVENYENSMGSTATALRLSLALADIAHEDPNTAVHNVILMGSHSHGNMTYKSYNNSNIYNETNNNTADYTFEPCIVRVDVSGNFYRCDATSVGHKGSKIRRWLETKGCELIMKENELPESKNSHNDNDILTALGLVYSCIVDNYDDLITENEDSLTRLSSSQFSTNANIEIAFNDFNYNDNKVIGPFLLSTNLFRNFSNANISSFNIQTQSMRLHGMKIWTFLLQSKLINQTYTDFSQRQLVDLARIQ